MACGNNGNGDNRMYEMLNINPENTSRHIYSGSSTSTYSTKGVQKVNLNTGVRKDCFAKTKTSSRNIYDAAYSSDSAETSQRVQKVNLNTGVRKDCYVKTKTSSRNIYDATYSSDSAEISQRVHTANENEEADEDHFYEEVNEDTEKNDKDIKPVEKLNAPNTQTETAPNTHKGTAPITHKETAPNTHKESAKSCNKRCILVTILLIIVLTAGLVTLGVLFLISNPQDCGQPTNVTNGIVVLDNVTNTQFGASAKLTCTSGYNGNTARIVCTEQGSWQSAVCTLKDCGPPSVANGIVVLDNNANTKYRATATLTCSSGYTANIANITCTEQGIWQNAECKPRDCGLPQVANGKIVLDNAASTTYGASATLTCNSGYDANTSRIACTAQGTWESAVCSARASNSKPAKSAKNTFNFIWIFLGSFAVILLL